MRVIEPAGLVSGPAGSRLSPGSAKAGEGSAMSPAATPARAMAMRDRGLSFHAADRVS
ncbi:hypothetical protein GCM10027203_40720 [Nonomuraea fastidiosa]